MKWLSSKMVSPITQIIEQHNISRYTTTLPYLWDVGLVETLIEQMTVQPLDPHVTANKVKHR